MPQDVSIYSREFKALTDRDEVEAVQSAMSVGRVRHNWLEMKEFTFGLLACQIGDVFFGNARTTSSTVWKEGVPADFVTVTRVREGGGFVTFADDAVEISAGDAYALSPGRGFTCHTPAYQDISIIAVPRPHLSRLGLPDDALDPSGDFAPIDSVATTLFDFFHSVALRMDSGAPLSSKALASVNDSIINMTATMLEENTPVAAPGLFPAAKAYIEEHLHDPELGPATVAAALHVSKRTLYRAFADRDQTVASYIRGARLRRVKRELDSAAGDASIRDVAERWGFTGGSYFAKLFQKEFGFVPSEYAKSLR